MKEASRQELLRSAQPPTPGLYECPMPGCKHKVKINGNRDASQFCPTHDIPLRFVKAG